MPDILKALEVEWGPRYMKQVRLFNPEGVEYDNNDDLRFVKNNENIYISKGNLVSKGRRRVRCKYRVL